MPVARREQRSDVVLVALGESRRGCAGARPPRRSTRPWPVRRTRGSVCSQSTRARAAPRGRGRDRPSRAPGSRMPLAVDRLRRRDARPARPAEIGRDQLVEQRGPGGVGREEGAEVGQVVLVRRKVVDDLDPGERPPHRHRIAHVTPEKLDFTGQVGGHRTVVHRRQEQIEHPHVVAAGQQRIHRVRPDKPRATRDQHPGHRAAPLTALPAATWSTTRRTPSSSVTAGAQSQVARARLASRQMRETSPGRAGAKVGGRS